jgi:hypothetical protein
MQLIDSAVAKKYLSAMERFWSNVKDGIVLTVAYPMFRTSNMQF